MMTLPCYPHTGGALAKTGKKDTAKYLKLDTFAEGHNEHHKGRLLTANAESCHRCPDLQKSRFNEYQQGFVQITPKGEINVSVVGGMETEGRKSQRT